jgi:transposase
MYQLDEEKLNERQEKAVLLLAEGKTSAEVAAEVGVDRTTIYRWKTGNARFIAELNRLRRSLWEAGENQLLSARTAALAAAMELLDHEDAKVRLRAIDTILRMKVPPANGPTSVRRAKDRVEINQGW